MPPQDGAGLIDFLQLSCQPGTRTKRPVNERALGALVFVPERYLRRPLGVGRSNMSNSVLSTGGQQVQLTPGVAARTREYRRWTAISDFTVAVICSSVALLVRFGRDLGIEYVLCGAIVPLLSVVTLSLSRACNVRCTGTGSEDFCKEPSAGFGLLTRLAIFSYASGADTVAVLSSSESDDAASVACCKRHPCRPFAAGRSSVSNFLISACGQRTTLAVREKEYLQRTATCGFAVACYTAALRVRCDRCLSRQGPMIGSRSAFPWAIRPFAPEPAAPCASAITADAVVAGAAAVVERFGRRRPRASPPWAHMWVECVP